MDNRILTDKDRNRYKPIINKMLLAVPDMMARKIPRSYVQQAFVIITVLKKAKKKSKILCVGSYEDTSYEYLKYLGYDIFGISPETNDFTLRKFLLTKPGSYDIIFSASVMEHVQDDTEFIKDICSLLNVNGTAILTVDFREDWDETKPRPSVDYRLYTSKDYKRISKILLEHNCFLTDEFIPGAKPDFELEPGMVYSFSTMVFKKLE